MQFQVTTTITSTVDADTFEPIHAVQIECKDALPQEVVRAVALGAARNLVLHPETIPNTEPAPPVNPMPNAHERGLA